MMKKRQEKNDIMASRNAIQNFRSESQKAHHWPMHKLLPSLERKHFSNCLVISVTSTKLLLLGYITWIKLASPQFRMDKEKSWKIVERKSWKETIWSINQSRKGREHYLCGLLWCCRVLYPTNGDMQTQNETGADQWWTPGAVYACQEKGWLSNKGFISWLEHFINSVKATKENSVILVLAGHVSRTKIW